MANTSRPQKKVFIVCASEINTDRLTSIEGLPSVTNIYDDKSKSECDARREAVWLVTTAVSVAMIRIVVWPTTVRIPVHVGSSSSAISRSDSTPGQRRVITIFVPLVWLVSGWLKSIV